MGRKVKKADNKEPKNKPTGPVINTVENQKYEVSEELSRISKKKKQK